jgi:hypothetical protein
VLRPIATHLISPEFARDVTACGSTAMGTSAIKGETMKTGKITLLALTAAFAMSFLTPGCDRTISHTESEKVKSDGTVEKKEKTVTEESDGTIKKEEKKSVDNP